jgi:methylmalonyl-CoA mutase
VFVRSMATRRANMALSESVKDALAVLKLAGFDLILLESSGIGQSDTEIVEHADVSLYVMTPEFGAQSQLEKIDMLDYADLVAINKFDRRGARDALRDVQEAVPAQQEGLRDRRRGDAGLRHDGGDVRRPGTNRFYHARCAPASTQAPRPLRQHAAAAGRRSPRRPRDPGERVRYLAEIVESNRRYNQWAIEQSDLAERLLRAAAKRPTPCRPAATAAREAPAAVRRTPIEAKLAPECRELLQDWDDLVAELHRRALRVPRARQATSRSRTTRTLAVRACNIPKVALPRFRSLGDGCAGCCTENVPGRFPFAAGVYPFKRTAEDPTRMFAGEGGPERTNKRFHYLSFGQPYKRLSTAFDSVTLYGEDPAVRPDIYGKVGNAASRSARSTTPSGSTRASTSATR